MRFNEEQKAALAMAVAGMAKESDPATAGQIVNEAMDAFVQMGLCKPEWANEIRAAAMQGLVDE